MEIGYWRSLGSANAEKCTRSAQRFIFGGENKNSELPWVVIFIFSRWE
jgi:hypothetical protein